MTQQPSNLKLLALDSEDLEVISAHCQDAIININDIRFLKQQNILSLLLKRFDWLSAENKADKRPQYIRHQTALHFKCVNRVQHLNLNKSNNAEALELLSINFKENDHPAGEITLIFSGGGEIKLDIECIEVELTDLGAAWEAKTKPSHDQ